MPPVMIPSAEERFDATLSNGGIADHWLGIAAIEQAYRDGFAAALAMLREPSDAILEAAAKAAFEATPNSTWEPEARAALAAAADAMGEAGTKKAGAE